MSVCEELSAAVQKGRAPIVVKLCREAVSSGENAGELLKNGLLDGMNVIGERFKNGTAYIPEVMIAARAMKAGIEELRPYLGENGQQSRGTAVVGTVKGDLHDIGKNLVKIMLEGKGFRVVDLGVDVSAASFIDAAVENDAGIVLCSALLTTTMSEMKNVVAERDARGLSGKLKIMVGGAPVTKEFCDSIGADGYAPDAASAADLAVSFSGGAA